MGSVVGWLQGGGCIEFYVNYIALTGINLFLVRCTATGLKYVKNRAQQHFPNFFTAPIICSSSVSSAVSH
jgi:hypothetical protein